MTSNSAEQTIIKAAEAILASAMAKHAAEKDKTKEKTVFNESSPNINNPVDGNPVDRAQGELSPMDTAGPDQSQGIIPPAQAEPTQVGDGAAPPQAMGAHAAAAGSSPAQADPAAISPYDQQAQDPMMAGAQAQAPAAGGDMATIAAQVARNFIGEEVYNAASNGHPQAMDIMARTAAQLGVGVAEAVMRATPNTATMSQMPDDPSMPTQGVDPSAVAAMGGIPQPEGTVMAGDQSMQQQAPGMMQAPVDPTMQAADQIIPQQAAAQPVQNPGTEGSPFTDDGANGDKKEAPKKPADKPDDKPVKKEGE